MFTAYECRHVGFGREDPGGMLFVVDVRAYTQFSSRICGFRRLLSRRESGTEGDGSRSGCDAGVALGPCSWQR